ncbi:hypothetical protein Hanom_Chr11g01053461 [Helianthus anomalus]
MLKEKSNTYDDISIICGPIYWIPCISDSFGTPISSNHQYRPLSSLITSCSSEDTIKLISHNTIIY